MATKSRQRTQKLRASCTECIRRKQRCNRDWPCNRCSSRGLSHICRFGNTKCRPERTSTDLRDCEGLASEGVDTPSPHNALMPALGVLGYAEHVNHFDLNLPNKHEVTTEETPGSIDTELQLAMQALPARSLTDSLIQHYFATSNYVYYSLHPPTFLKDYEDWNVARLDRSRLSPAFASLLLQVCANAAQCPTDDLQHALEYDLLERTEHISERLHSAANRLGRSLMPGSGGLHRITQLLCAAAWLKSEGRIVDGWHTLAAAIHEEQESGIDGVTEPESLPQMEHEMRRRIWCFSVIWDWQMAEWLARPRLLDLNKIGYRLPNLELDRGKPEEPSPLTNLVEQYKLVTTLATTFGRIPEISDPNSVRAVQDAISAWLARLTPSLRIQNPDTRWDDVCPWLPAQRAQLHSFALMAKLTPLKRYMTSRPSVTTSEEDVAMRASAFDTSIDCVNAALRLHNIMSSKRTKFHFAIFALFDTATLMCSGLLHDDQIDLCKRSDVIDAVSMASNALQEASKVSKCASQACRVLRWLFSRVRSGEQHRPPLTASSDKSTVTMPDTSPQASSSLLGASNEAEDLLSNLHDFDWTNIDLGGMKEIWDWNALGV